MAPLPGALYTEGMNPLHTAPLQGPLILHHRTPAELHDSLTQTLATRKQPREKGTWLFTYGILAKNPPFTPVVTKALKFPGFHRTFNLADPLNRGTPESPGLTLGTAPGGTCKGLAYLINAEQTEEALARVWEQEMLLPFYIPTWKTLEGEEYLVMETDPESPALRPHLTEAQTTAIIAESCGEAGSNLQYLNDILTIYTAHHSPPIL